jgi:hypothetical protein
MSPSDELMQEARQSAEAAVTTASGEWLIALDEQTKMWEFNLLQPRSGYPYIDVSYTNVSIGAHYTAESVFIAALQNAYRELLECMEVPLEAKTSLVLQKSVLAKLLAK